MGPAPATSAWWALGAGAIIRAFPCSALAASVAESWHSNPRPSSYLRRCATRSGSARAACELGTNRRPPRACPPGSLCITAGIDSNSRRLPFAALPSPAHLFRSLATAALARPFHVARCLSPPFAFDPRPYLPLPSDLLCLTSAAQGNGSRRSPVLPAPPSLLRSAVVHCICCRVRAAPPMRTVCGCRSRCARLLLARSACARASV
jgi:hypothetical protein